MATTAVKREHPQPVAWVDVRPTKLQRTTVIHNGVVPPQPQPGHPMGAAPMYQYQPMYDTSGYPSAQSQASRDAVWKTISTMDVNVLREQIFHATMGDMTLPQITSRVLDAHSNRLRLEAQVIDNAKKAQEAKEKRDRKKVFNFDSHLMQIDDWLSNDPIDRKPCRTSYNIYEKIMTRIGKITAKATEATTNVQSKCNALGTLTWIVESMIDNRTGAMGCEIWSYMSHDGSTEESMMKILRTMSPAERERLLTLVLEDSTLWIEKMKTLAARSQAAYDPRFDRQGPPFPQLSEVLAFVTGPRIKKEMIDQLPALQKDTHDPARVKQEPADAALGVQRPADAIQFKQEVKQEVQVKQEIED